MLSKGGQWLRWVQSVSLLAALCLLIYPIYVIRPFRAQGVTELAAALAVRRWAPLGASLFAAIALICAAVLWRRRQTKAARVFTVALASLAVTAAALTRVNIYELMFHRIDAPATIPAGEANLEPGDMVLAISAGGEARAYPIRMMGYQHIVNDVLGGVPVAGTY